MSRGNNRNSNNQFKRSNKRKNNKANKKNTPLSIMVTNAYVKNFYPKNRKQELFYSLIDSDKVDVLIGAPGTGKTALAIYKALKLIESEDNDFNTIKIFRSAETSEEIGHLPGTKEEKASPFETGVRDIFNKFLGETNYDTLKQKGVIQFDIPAHERSTTHENVVVIVDEIQNLSENTLDTLYTRGGESSHLILCGDYYQADKRSGKNNILTFLDNLVKMKRDHDIDDSNFFVFMPDDIVRHGRVKRYIQTKYGKEYQEMYKKYLAVQAEAPEESENDTESNIIEM